MVYCKKFLIVFFIVCFLLTFYSSVFAVTQVDPTHQQNLGGSNRVVITDNQLENLYLLQYNAQANFISTLYTYIPTNSSAVRQVLTYILNYTKSLGTNSKQFIFVQNSISDPIWSVYSCKYVSSGTIYDNAVVGNYVFSNVEIINYTDATLISSISSNGNVRPNYTINLSVAVPKGCINIFHPGFIDLFKYFGLIGSDNSTSVIENKLNELVNKTEQDYTSVINRVNSSVNRVDTSVNNKANEILKANAENSQKLDNSIKEQTQSINNINSSINNPNVDSSDLINNLPNNSTTDITENGFSNIFDRLYNVFMETSKPITIPIPFVNQNVEISINTIFANSTLYQYVKNIASVVWYFTISIFILKDIASKFNKIKQGNVENLETGNIKEDLL